MDNEATSPPLNSGDVARERLGDLDVLVTDAYGGATE